MINNPEIQKALYELLAVCKENDVPLSGIFEINGRVSAFDNNAGFSEQNAQNIQKLITLKGNLDHFLIEMSKNDATLISETDTPALTYLLTNEQVRNTRH